MCPCREKTGWILLGLGIGLIASIAFSGWFLRLLLGAAFLAVGLLMEQEE